MVDFADPLVKYLHERNLVDPETIEAGQRLTAQEAVRFVQLERREVEAIVKDGSRQYSVFVSIQGIGYLNMRCHCTTMMRQGAVCRHVVATLLAAEAALVAPKKRKQSHEWGQHVQQLLKRWGASPAASRHLVPLFSLQRSRSYWGVTWSLAPYVFSLRHLEALPFDLEYFRRPEMLHEVLDTYDLWPKARPFRRQDFSILVDDLPQNVLSALHLLLETGDTAYYYVLNAQKIIGPALEMLSLTPDYVLLYLGNEKEPFQQPLKWLSAPLSLRLAVNRRPDGSLLVRWEVMPDDVAGLLTSPQDVVEITDTNAPSTWVVVARRYIGRIPPPLAAADISEALAAPETIVEPDEVEVFLDEVLPAVTQAENIALRGAEITWEECREESVVPRLYLFEEGNELRAELRFGYGEHEVAYDRSYPRITTARKPGTWTLVRVYRDPQAEEEAFKQLSSYGLKRGPEPGLFLLRKNVHPVDFLLKHVPRLVKAGYEIYGEERLKSVRVNRNRPTISLSISSGIDWFDVQAVVKFGEVPVSLKEIRRALRKRQRYVKLADGSIGEIPEEWIKRYRHLFELGQEAEENHIRLSAHHALLVEELAQASDEFQADDQFRERLERLRSFEGIESRPLPKGFVGELRPYQKAGYDWLHFLHEYDFGGCLADDMGLGKTVQALAFLLSLRESGHAQAADLIVVPRSLLVNWEREAARFTPSLRVLIHAGQSRIKSPKVFDEYDLVITTYGLVLRDLKVLQGYRFHYVVLDESQAVKNPVTKTARAVRRLQSDHRLALTGTPVQNTSLELWSLFAFLNPGLLGSLEYFKREFASPIERQRDEETAQFLQKLVYPFILRRTKEQVAPELPPRTERVLFCDMEPAQRRLYERWRDHYRAVLLGMIEEDIRTDVRMKILEGLLRLRQIAIHPLLVDGDYRGKSAKFELLVELLDTLRSEGHKALIFSQFVEALKLVRGELDRQQVPYAYLDGRTRKRQEQVDRFQSDPSIPFFLISLKAGGLGLNLTAADYVIHLDPWWNPAVEAQAADRTHRIGQDKPVFIYRLITRNTVEEKILQLQERKRHLVDQLITTDQSFFKSLTREDVELLFAE